MTVGELIKILGQYELDTPVRVWDLGYGGMNPKILVEDDTDEDTYVVSICGASEDEDIS